MAKKLRREGFDVSVDLQNTKWTHLLAALASIPNRFGFRRGNFGFLMNRQDSHFDVVDSPVKHQFRILSKLGIKNLDERLELWPEPSSEERIGKLLSERGAGESSKLVGFAVGASRSWPSKCWPLEYYQQLARLLIQHEQCHIVLIGAEAGASQASEWVREDKDKILDLIGKTSLLDLVSLIKKLNVLVTGDTAPLHVAAAVNTKVVTLFGPTDPKRHVPVAENIIVLARHLTCQPCYDGQCREEDKLACLKKIPVEEVFKCVRKFLTP
jgi:lipopolysaccharide heptosyltransferase II